MVGAIAQGRAECRWISWVGAAMTELRRGQRRRHRVHCADEIGGKARRQREFRFGYEDLTLDRQPGYVNKAGCSRRTPTLENGAGSDIDLDNRSISSSCPEGGAVRVEVEGKNNLRGIKRERGSGV